MDDGSPSASYAAWALQRDKAAAFDAVAHAVGRSPVGNDDVEGTLQFILRRLGATQTTTPPAPHSGETHQQHRLVPTSSSAATTPIYWTCRTLWQPYFAAVLDAGPAGDFDGPSPAYRNVEVGTPLDLPSQRALRDALGKSSSPKRKERPRWAPAGFRLERGSARTWGTNALLDDLESKDGLARRIAEAGADALAPESVVIPWDSENLPADAARLLADAVADAARAVAAAASAGGSTKDPAGTSAGGVDAVVVLKPAMGSGGKGIEFHDARDPETAGRIVLVVRENAAAARKEGAAFLHSVRARNNGNVPGASVGRLSSSPSRLCSIFITSRWS
jgi:hypothetical protein